MGLAAFKKQHSSKGFELYSVLMSFYQLLTCLQTNVALMNALSRLVFAKWLKTCTFVRPRNSSFTWVPGCPFFIFLLFPGHFFSDSFAGTSSYPWSHNHEGPQGSFSLPFSLSWWSHPVSWPWISCRSHQICLSSSDFSPELQTLVLRPPDLSHSSPDRDCQSGSPGSIHSQHSLVEGDSTPKLKGPPSLLFFSFLTFESCGLHI